MKLGRCLSYVGCTRRAYPPQRPTVGTGIPRHDGGGCELPGGQFSEECDTERRAARGPPVWERRHSGLVLLKSGDAGLEERRLGYRRHQRVERRLDNAGGVGEIVRGRESRVSADVFDPAAAYDSWRTGSQGEAEEGRDQGDGDALSLDLFRYRCAATIAGPSGGHHDNAVHTPSLEYGRHLTAHAPRIGDRGAAAGSRQVLRKN